MLKSPWSPFPHWVSNSLIHILELQDEGVAEHTLDTCLSMHLRYLDDAAEQETCGRETGHCSCNRLEGHRCCNCGG